MNHFLEYYRKHNISPVKQDISNLVIHLRKRENLYRQLGIPAISFKDKEILEIGAGSGYNSLGFIFTGCKKVTIVEPNKKGIEDINELFTKMNIPKDKYEIINTKIEDVLFNKKFDFIIAEGFLHFIDNAMSIIENMKDLLNNGGVITVTCMDYFSTFVEQIKRFVINIILKDNFDYEQKIQKCVEFFTPQMKCLKNMSRSVRDWAIDDILNPAFNNYKIFTIEDAINLFKDEFYLLGGSQNIFCDYSWYKDIDFDLKADYIKQYRKKRHNFTLYGAYETVIEQEKSDLIYKKIFEIRKNCIEYENNYESKYQLNVSNLLKDILNLFYNEDENIYNFIKDSIEILERLNYTDNVQLSSYEHFYKAVGRTQQYLSFSKKYEYNI